MARWFLTPPLPGESPQDALQRLTHEHNLILSELEQLDLQLRGDGGYTAKLSGTLDAQGHRIIGLPNQPTADGDACSLSFHKSGRFLYTEGDTFHTSKRIEHLPARNGPESVTLAQVRAIIAASLQTALPSGVILLWSGSVATIPSGWTLCDGTSGTPDLRNRFVPGAGGAYVPGATGGADSLNLAHTHTADGTLAAAAESAHTHGDGTYATDSISAGTPAGTVAAIAATATAAVQRRTDAPTADTADQVHTHPAPAFTGSALAGHSHDVTGASGAGSAHVHDVTGSTDSQLSATTENRPQFYALAYIMKL